MPSSDFFIKDKLKKRTEFHNLIHAAFVLDDSVTFYLTRPQPTPKELSWLKWVYPGSEVERGEDQGATYCTITPKF